MIRLLALGIVGVCLIALLTRVAPDLWPIAPNAHAERLSYPLTYWNALGLLTSVGIVLCLHLTASGAEPPWVRLPAAAAVPVLCSTLLLTFSRGAIAAGALGLIAYIVVGRPRAAWGALAAVVPTSIVAGAFTLGAERLASVDFASPAAADEGRRLALVILLCALAAALARAAFASLEGRFPRPASIGTVGRRAMAGALAACVIVAVAVGGPLAEAPAYVERQYERFVDGEAVVGETPRARLVNPSNNGRSEQWQVALDRFAEAPVGGAGAGTFKLFWAQDRRGALTVSDGHSLYFEVLGELGVVGLLLIAGVIGVLLACLARRARGRHRSLYAALFAATLAWAVHAGADWDWEMPAVTLWVFALGGAGLAARTGERRLSFAPPPAARFVLALAWISLALAPALAALSQHHLDRAVSALKRGDCERAIASADSSLGVVSVRPEPWEVVGYCAARQGHAAASVQAFVRAIDNDPDNWELHYGLALVRGAGGLDPRASARRALELNPNEELTRLAADRFRGAGPSGWRREALAAPLPIP
jgi:hypothetical protein